MMMRLLLIMVIGVVDAEERVGPDSRDARLRSRRQALLIDGQRVGRRDFGVRRRRTINDQRVAATARHISLTAAGAATQCRDDRAQDTVVTLATRKHRQLQLSPTDLQRVQLPRHHRTQCLPANSESAY